MRIRFILFVALAVLAMAPYTVNWLGWNVYLYTNVGDDDLIFAAAQGKSHQAIAEHFELDADWLRYAPGDFRSHTILHTGPFHLFAEPIVGVPHGLALGTFEDPGYRGFEFPWLLWPLMFGVMALASYGRRPRPCQAAAGDG